MKKLLTILTACLMTVSLAACSTGGDKPKEEEVKTPEVTEKVLGIVMPNATHGFTGESIKHAEAAANQLGKEKGITIKFLTSAEASEQNNQIDTLVNEKVDCIVLWPHNGDELRSAAMKATDAEIPLIIYDRLIDGFTPTAEIMGDNTTIGEMTGTYFNNYFAEDLKAGKVNVLEFKGDNSTVPEQRSKGFASTMDPNINIVQQFSTDWQRAKAMEQMETYLNNTPVEEVEALRAVFTHDDEVLLGVIDAIKGYKGGATLDIRLLSGVGGRKENLEIFDSVKEELGIDQVTYSFSPTMVRDAVSKGVEVIEGKEVSGLILIPTEEIDNTNYKEFMKGETWKIRYDSGI